MAIESVSLDILLLLNDRMHDLSMQVMGSLPHSQIELFVKIAVDHNYSDYAVAV